MDENTLLLRANELNPQMLTAAERMRIIDWIGGLPPHDWVTYTFPGQCLSTATRFTEPSPVWKEEYGSEEIRECLDVEEW